MIFTKKELVYGGTSKSFGMAGLRTAWIVTQYKKLLKNILRFKDYVSICNSVPSEILTLMALNNIEKIKQNIKLFKECTIHYGEIFSIIIPRAGSTEFVKLSIKSLSLEFSNKLIA